MNSPTWIISPNWLAWLLLGLATASLVAIAVRLWVQEQTARNTNHNRGEAVAWIAIVLALISGVCVFFKTSDPNNASMLITALGVMVTLLLGWQIYKAVEFNRIVERINATQQRLANLEHETRAGIEFAIGFPTIGSNPQHTLTQCMVALDHLNEATEANYDNVIRAMLLISEQTPFEIINKPRLLAALFNSHRPEADALIRTFSSWPEAPRPRNASNDV